MGHRHVFSPSYIFETENDQRWNLTEHPYAHTAHNDAIESSPRSYTANNMSINGEQYPSNSNPADASNQYYSLAHAIETPHYQLDPVGPSNPPTVPENYGNVASSSNHNELPVPEEESFDVRGSNGRWNCKRKRPDVPTEDTDRFANNVGGSSSNISTPTDSWDDTPNLDFLDTPWDHPNVKYAHGDGSYYRNVRSRTEHNTSSHDYHTTRHPMDVSSHGSMTEWNPNHTSSSGHGQELNPFLVGSSTSSNNVPQDFHGIQVQSVRGTRRHYVQRSAPPFRASSSSLQLEHADEGLQLANESYSSPPPRPAIAWRSSDRNPRGRMSIERFRSEMANFRDRHAPEGLMIMDHSAFGSRNIPDHHREMMLDIDDMSYEELLALGERIGSVNTGLTEDMIAKCLRESIYCSSDQIQEEGTCVICLEEYANMDDVGMLKGCKHDFHVGCIKKWLSMKNLCPICKSEPVKHK